MVGGVAAVVLVRAMSARAKVVVVDYDARSGTEELFVGGDVAVVVCIPVNGRTTSMRRIASTGAAGDGTAGDGVIRGTLVGSCRLVEGCVDVAIAVVVTIAACVSGLVGPGRG